MAAPLGLKILRRLRLFGLDATVPCIWCLKPCTLERSTTEHMVPKAHGGTNAQDNLEISCRKCNSRRSDSMEWKPARPRRQICDYLTFYQILTLRAWLLGQDFSDIDSMVRSRVKRQRQAAKLRAAAAALGQGADVAVLLEDVA